MNKTEVCYRIEQRRWLTGWESPAGDGGLKRAYPTEKEAIAAVIRPRRADRQR